MVVILMKNKDINIEKIPDTFTGRAEVKGFKFTKLEETPTGFLFKVESSEQPHYEVFKYKLTPICLDFEKRIYSETEFKEHYPKRNSFGIWAWTTLSYEKALLILKKLEDEHEPKA